MKRVRACSRAHERTERAARPEKKTHEKQKDRHKRHRRASERPWMNCPKVKARIRQLRPFVIHDRYPVIIPRVEPIHRIGFSHEAF